MSTPVLHSYWRSTSAWRVRIALNLKGIKYEYHAVNLLKGDQASEAHKEKNPMGQIPVLEIDGQTLTQSLPIIEYLEETSKSGQRLLPEDPVKRAQARAIAEMINSGTQPIQNLFVLKTIVEWTGDDSNKAKWAKFFIQRGLEAVEQELKKCAGKFCVGDEVSIADLCLIPQMYNAKRFGVDTSNMETINRIVEAASELEEFKAADPSVQPDATE